MESPGRPRLVIGLSAAAVLVVAGIVATVLLTGRTVDGDVQPAERAARSYAAALVAQRWQDAHDQLCAKDRTTSTTEQLAARYGVPRRTGFTVLNVAVNGNHGHYSAFTDIEFTTADGPTTTHIPLVADGSRWRPCP